MDIDLWAPIPGHVGRSSPFAFLSRSLMVVISLHSPRPANCGPAGRAVLPDATLGKAQPTDHIIRLEECDQPVIVAHNAMNKSPRLFHNLTWDKHEIV